MLQRQINTEVKTNISQFADFLSDFDDERCFFFITVFKIPYQKRFLSFKSTFFRAKKQLSS